MKKKKTIILTCAIVVVVVIALVLGLLFKKNMDSKKSDAVTIITLDINPSMELEIKGDKVNTIKALNDDAEKLINKDMEGKEIDTVFDSIVKNARDNGYMEDDHLSIILGMEKTNKQLEDKLREACERNNIRVEIIVPEITEEAKKEAEGYGVTPAKAAYILSIIKDNKELHFDDLKDKSAIELQEMKNSGYWCNHGYVLHGSDCEKAIREEEPKEGEVCPTGTMEYKGKCYEDTGIIDGDKLFCQDGYTLKDDKCVTTRSTSAIPSGYGCVNGVAKTKGEVGLAPKESGDARDIICVNETDIIHAVSPCMAHDGTESMISGGKCYWHRAPVIASGCPGKIQVGDECWDDATGIYICPGRNNGTIYNSPDALCLVGNNYTNATVSEYKCESGYTLDGNKCVKEEMVDAERERICPDGYTKTDDDGCINLNKEKQKEKGFVCNKEARLVNNKCVYYGRVEANHK